MSAPYDTPHSRPNDERSSLLGYDRLVAPLHRLPEEIPSEIFMNNIFDSIYEQIHGSLSAKQEVYLIYRRLYGLLGVCNTWRGILLSRGVFWSIIPIFELPSAKKRESIELVLKRAGESKLHLVAMATSPVTSEYVNETLIKHSPHLYAINFTADRRVLVDSFEKLLQGTPGSLTELSIQRTKVYNSPYWIPSDSDYIIRPSHPHQSKFSSLVQTLIAFRIRGVHLHWHTISFSTRLTELHIENITLGYDSAIYPLLQALSSASALRDLKIICMDTFYDLDSMADVAIPSPIVLPNLRSLYIENIYFHTLRILLVMITARSHRLTLFLNPVSLRTNIFGRESQIDIDITDLCRVLEKVPVDTLMLNGRQGTQWLTGTIFYRLLGALPALKTLKMHSWEFDENIWNSLTRPSGNQKDPEGGAFPALENLQLTTAKITTEEGFENMVASHPLRRAILGATMGKATTATTFSKDTESSPFEESGSMANCLGDKVPDFRLVDNNHVPFEFQMDRWPLW